MLTEELVREAISLALPTVREIVEKHSWGPKGVVIAVGGKGLENHVVHVMEELGPEKDWKNLSGERINFRIIALEKLAVTLREGRTSRSVVATSPWSLEEGDSLYQGGAAEDTNLAVTASGAYGDTDEAISWIVWNIIFLLCSRKIAELRESGVNRVE